MPPLETDDLLQRAVLWRKQGVDEYNEPIRGTPTEIWVRWEYKRTEMVRSDGTPVIVDALAVVAQRVEVDDQMWLGELVDWLGTGSQFGDDEVMWVRVYTEIPDIKNREIRRTVGLAYFRDTPPATS